MGISRISDPLSGGIFRNTAQKTYDQHQGAHAVGAGELAAEQSRLGQQNRQFGEAQINNIYNSPERQAQYTDYINGLRGLYTGQVNDQQDVASRQLKFANARSGNTGGSVAADNGAMLRKDYQQGLLSAEDTAQAGGSALRASDQAEKERLIGLNNSATATGQEGNNALAQAVQSTSANANAGQVANLGDFFSNLGGAYQNKKKIDAANRGYLYGVS